MAKTVTTSRALVRNTFFNLLMLMSNAIVAFLLVRSSSVLGRERNGVWVLIGSVFRYRILLGMGLNSAINRRIPMYLAKDDEDGIRRTVSTALFFFTIIAVVLVDPDAHPGRQGRRLVRDRARAGPCGRAGWSWSSAWGLRPRPRCN